MSDTAEQTVAKLQAKLAAINDQNRDQKARAQGLYNLAESCAQGHKFVTIGELRTHYEGAGEKGGKQASDRSVAVQAKFKESSFLVFRTAEPQEVKAGMYKLSDLVTVTGSDAGRSANQEHRFACMCTIRKQQISANVMFPDIYDLYSQSDKPTDLENPNVEEMIRHANIDSGGVDRALRMANVRSMDNFLGYVRLQMEFGATDPRLLVTTLHETRRATVRVKGEGESAMSQQEVFEQKFKEALKPGGGPTEQIDRPGMIGRFLDFVKGKQEVVDGDLMEPTQPITFADLYPLLRFELTRVVSTAVRQYTAEDMYDNPEQRDKLQLDIQRHMSESLKKYGLALTRVSALQFVSEGYQEKLDAAAELALRRQLLDLQRNAAEARADQLKIEAQVQEAEIARDQSVGVRRAQAATAINDERLTGKLSMDARQADADRRKRIADAQAEADAFKAGFEVYTMVNDYKAKQLADQRRQLAELPADKLLPILMAENPALQQAFVAAQQAKSGDERFAAEVRIRNEMSAMHREHGGNLQALMLEAAKQVGHVTGKLLEGKREPGSQVDVKLIEPDGRR